MTFEERAQTLPAYAGRRMSAEEYLNLPDDGFRYELIDGVVVMSPSPTPDHQGVVSEICRQIGNFLVETPVGRVYPEVDVRIGGKTVYRPDVVFVRSGRLAKRSKRIDVPPDLVVEVVSPEGEEIDFHVKREAYERLGVGEYWIVDPASRSVTFLRSMGGRFAEAAPEGDAYRAQAVPGFVLDLAALRRVMDG